MGLPIMLCLSQEIALYNMAIATAILSMAFGVTVPPTTAIMGGMTSTGKLVANPHWEANDFALLRKAGVDKVILPACAHAKVQKIIGEGGGGGVFCMEVIGVQSIQQIVDVVLKPLQASSTAAAGGVVHGDDEEDDDDDNDQDFSAFHAISIGI